jgi:predicted nuclease with TOPRIM domain
MMQFMEQFQQSITHQLKQSSHQQDVKHEALVQQYQQVQTEQSLIQQELKQLAVANGSMQETMTQRLDAIESEFSRRDTFTPQSPDFGDKFQPGSLKPRFSQLI